MSAVPPVHRVIEAYGVKLKGQQCSNCRRHSLYEVDDGKGKWIACSYCDVAVEAVP